MEEALQPGVHAVGIEASEDGVVVEVLALEGLPALPGQWLVKVRSEPSR